MKGSNREIGSSVLDLDVAMLQAVVSNRSSKHLNEESINCVKTYLNLITTNSSQSTHEFSYSKIFR